MIMLYWGIGKEILKRQEEEEWGSKVIDCLSKDLKDGFLDMQEFSSQNLKYMRKLAKSWSSDVFVQQCCTNSVGSNRILFRKGELEQTLVVAGFATTAMDG
jgi:hypothetical protein